jgi:hypothetical protein
LGFKKDGLGYFTGEMAFSMLMMIFRAKEKDELTLL